MFIITPKKTQHIHLISTLKIPLVFGIERMLMGTSMEYIEKAGQIGFAFESGTHGSEIAKQNAIAGLMSLMVNAGYIPADKLDKFEMYISYLMDKVNGLPHKLDFVYKHMIEEKDKFLMNPSFRILIQ